MPFPRLEDRRAAQALFYAFLVGLALIVTALTYQPLETRVKIAIIDTGIDMQYLDEPYFCKTGHADFTGTGLQDQLGHGTNIAGILRKSLNPKTHCLVILKYVDDSLSGYATMQAETKAIRHAIFVGASYINLSGGGPIAFPPEKEALQLALSRGITIAVAAGNGGFDLAKYCDFYPACYYLNDTKYHIVAHLEGKKIARTSNFNGPVTDYRQGTEIEGYGIKMTGTSQATAVLLGELIR